MKNIHLLRTNLSRLYNTLSMSGYNLKNLKLSEIPKRKSSELRPQHLYITNDEEIREGDWFMSNLNEILKCTKKEDKFVWYERLTVPGVSKIAQPFSIHINLKPKKIILTTDQDLIEDGVQAIDDEFLEWFVKNPSCEEVDLDTFSMGDKILYNVVFPKEEPKDVILGYKTSIEAQMLDKVEPKQEKTFEDVLDESLAKGKAILEELKTINAKQETLEEAAEKYARKQCDDMYDNQGLTGASWGWETSLDFIAGAKWMQERMYSEKDMNDYAEYCIDIVLAQNCVYPVTPKEWFKQFKKK